MRRLLILIGFMVGLWQLPVYGQEMGAPADVAFKARCDGTEQRYILVLPKEFKPGEPHDVLIALHGHGSDRWQFVKGAFDEARAVRDVAAARRMILVSPDYRAKTSWMGPKAEADVVQIIEMLHEQYRVRKTFICGASMGGASCLTFAALHPGLIDGVASMNGTANHLAYGNFQDAIAESFGGSKVEIPLEYKKRSAEYWPERFTMPTGIAAGGKDVSVPAESVQRLAGVLKKLQRPVLLVYRENGGHNTSYGDAKQILEFALNPAPASAPSAGSKPASPAREPVHKKAKHLPPALKSDRLEAGPTRALRWDPVRRLSA